MVMARNQQTADQSLIAMECQQGALVLANQAQVSANLALRDLNEFRRQFIQEIEEAGVRLNREGSPLI